MKRPSFLTWRNLLITFLVALLGVVISLVPPLDTLEKKFFDLSFQIRGAEPAHPDIVIIEINDQSLKRLGTWPWPRVFHAQLLKILTDSKPSVVFFDMIFSEKSNPLQDELFSDAVKNAGNVILSYYFAASKAEEMREPEALPIEMFRNNARGLGFVNSFPDNDGYIRRYTLSHHSANQTYYHSSLAIAGAHLGWDQKMMEEFSRGAVLINFPGPYSQFRILPFEEVTASWGHPEAKSLFESLRGKIILVGHTATGTAMDLKPTAFSNQYPGVGTQASMVHTLLSGKFIHRLAVPIHFILLWLFLLLILALAENKKPAKGFLFMIAALLLLFQAAQVCFIYARIWVPFASFLVTGLLTHMTVTLINFVKVHFEKEIFSRELSLATRIQSNLLRSEMPVIEGLEVAAITIPARHVGGDLYDILTLENNKCGICIGDVSGKGIPAALFMAKAISEFRRETHAAEPAAVVKNLNARLSEGGFSGLFITLLYIMVEPRSRKYSFANGGHEPILHYRKKTQAVDQLMTDKGGPLGIDPDTEFDQKEDEAQTGDIILISSDGIKEAFNAKKEIFGFDRMKAAILESSDKTPNEIIQHMLKRIQEFVKSAPQHDDMTIVCAKFV